MTTSLHTSPLLSTNDSSPDTCAKASAQTNRIFSKDIYSPSRIKNFDELRKNKIRFRNSRLHWEQIPRSNNPSKPLQEKAVNILATIVYKLRKADVITLNHNYLSRLTKCGRDQNVNLLKQLADMLDISFHAKTTIDSKVFRNCYVIKYTSQGHSIIESPSVLLAQEHFVGNKAVTPVQTLPANHEIKLSGAEKIPPSIYNEYKEEVFKNNRSTKATFFKKEVSSKEEGDKKEESDLEIQDKTNASEQAQTTNRQLKDFYPLSNEDGRKLQILSGRQFSLNAMNEILLNMSKRLKDRYFENQRAFLSYMTQVFKYEMRSCDSMNNAGFKINSNLSAEEKTAQQQEQYLTKIENQREVSPEMHFKKKLAAVLPREKAYELLNAYQGCEVAPTPGNSVKTEKKGHSEAQSNAQDSERATATLLQGKHIAVETKEYEYESQNANDEYSGEHASNEWQFKLLLTREVKLTELQQEIVLQQAKATHERWDIDAGELPKMIGKLDIIILKTNTQSVPVGEQRKIDYLQGNVIPPNSIEKYQGVWGEIRKAMIKAFRYNLDFMWLSKLTPQFDEQLKSVNLVCPNSFVMEWLSQNHGSNIKQLFQEHSYSCFFTSLPRQA